MRLVALFLAAVAVVAGAVALVNWRVDSFGVFYESDVLRAARASGCLISNELVSGGNYLRFKEDVFRSRPTSTFVVGSSRVLKIAARPGEETFSNLGMPSASPESILDLFRSLPARPLTAYVGVDLPWFNPSWQPLRFGVDLVRRLGHLLSRSELERSWRFLEREPSLLLHRWRRLEVGGRCVLGRFSPGIGWKADGSRLYSFELDPRRYPPPSTRFRGDVERIRRGVYADWDRFDRERLAELDEALDQAERKGWLVVGFSTPDSSRYAHLFATAPETAARVREFAREVPRLFREHGFPWLDLHDVRSVPCAQTDFVDAGSHPNAECAMRIRARLDAAAARASSVRRRALAAPASARSGG